MSMPASNVRPLADGTSRPASADAFPPRLSAAELSELDEPLESAQRALAKLDLLRDLVPSIEWFIYAFMRREALASLLIDGSSAALLDVFSFEHADQAGTSSLDALEDVVNTVATLNYALGELRSQRGLPLSVRLLNECHRRLLQAASHQTQQPGALRGAPQRTAELLAAVEHYVHADAGLPPLLRIAAVHAQFMSIEPYWEANGRIGRLLTSLLFHHWRLLSSPLLYLSVHFERNSEDYHQLLDGVRTAGRWLDWLRFFLTAVATIATDAVDCVRRLHGQVTEDRRRLLASHGVTVSAIQLFEALPNHPVVSMPMVTRLLDTTKPTAGHAIELLQSIEILAERGERKRDRLYQYSRYLSHF